MWVTVKCILVCFLKNEWRLLIVYFLRAASYFCFLCDVIPPRAVCVAFFPSPPLQWYFRFFLSSISSVSPGPPCFALCRHVSPKASTRLQLPGCLNLKSNVRVAIKVFFPLSSVSTPQWRSPNTQTSTICISKCHMGQDVATGLFNVKAIMRSVRRANTTLFCWFCTMLPR